MFNRIKKIYSIIKSFLRYKYYSIFCSINNIENNDVWLISERGDDARDNGYWLYKYLKDRHPEVKVKYVISKKSPDRSKISDGDIVEFGSKSHYVLFLTAGKLISTHTMGFSPNYRLFNRMNKKGLLHLKGRTVFLQHGITKDYIDSFSRKNAKIDLVICGAKPEYEYMISRYGYDRSNAVYTGFARFDHLVDESSGKRQILVMPTFRRYLNYINNFESTDYYHKWNSFLNNKELIKYLEEKDIKLVFYPHYEIQKWIHHFRIKSKKIIIAKKEEYDVQKLLKESNLLVTDYSSVAFDFAYLNKKVLYYQFDQDQYRNKHYSEGYFDYKKDGFGPVCDDEHILVRKIIESGLNARVDANRLCNIYSIHDTHNCERIYDAIKQLEKNKIMIVSNKMNVGGIESFLMNVVRNINKDKNMITFLTYSDERFDFEEEIEKNDCRLLRIASPLKRRCHMKELYEVMSIERPDCVHCNTYYDAACVMMAAKKYGVKVRISHSHTTQRVSMVKNFAHMILRRIIVSKSTHLVSCGEAASHNLFGKAESIIIKNGVEVDKYRFNKRNRERARKEIGLSSSNFVLGHIGRFVDAKNHSFILDVFERIYKNDTRARLVLVGTGPELDNVKKKANDLEISNGIIYLGARSDVNIIINAIDSIIMPSKYEGVPLSLVESQINGLPIYASDRIPEEAKYNDTYNILSLNFGAEHWAEYIINDSHERVLPNKRLINDYSIKNVVNKLDKIYNSWR